MSHQPPLALFAMEPLIFDDGAPCAHAVFEQAMCALGIADTLTNRPMASIIIHTEKFPLADERLPKSILIVPDDEDTVAFGSLVDKNLTDEERQVQAEAMASIHTMAHELYDIIESDDDDRALMVNIIDVLDDLIGATNIKSNYFKLSLLMIGLFMRLYGLSSAHDFIEHLLKQHIYDPDSLIDEISDYLKDH